MHIYVYKVHRFTPSHIQPSRFKNVHPIKHIQSAVCTFVILNNKNAGHLKWILNNQYHKELHIN